MDTDNEIRVLRNALWIMVDKVAKVADLELLFGEGMTETELVMDCIKESRLFYKNEKINKPK